MSDWEPDLYLKFEKERTQPSIDLVTKIKLTQPRKIIDIGCGPGNSTHVLQNRWPTADITGLDNSKAMLEKAGSQYKNIHWLHQDAAQDLSALGTFDIVFSNAALQWLPDQPSVLLNLYRMVNKHGVLAVQVPFTAAMPVHTELKKLAASPEWEKYFSKLPESHSIYPANFYYDILCGLTQEIDLWETNYYYIMPSRQSITQWYSSTGLKPYLDHLAEEKLKTRLLDDYESALTKSYPQEKDGKVLFPFTRIFFIATKP